ncbi:hypothetical protein SEA_CHRIS_65 [Mycobacterium phage Chris]|uniref:Uncharacterized protein n=1 Tax=Mycobacterium phage Chris TaxID=2725626 RepID=A0A6M3SXJ4_9CAUD|nr:hypothetical protein I5G96_gp040 [Mycobacterium phage Chris]QJD50467.1 hypothetical protein SEA_CHRIS_65 [Mycobacterium phage Chris]
MQDDDVMRYAWQQQVATATATERVQERQIRLLRTQREIIDDQLDKATRKRDQATSAVLSAQRILDQMAARPAAAMPTRDELAGWASTEHVDLGALGALLDNGKPPTDNGEGLADEVGK